MLTSAAIPSVIEMENKRTRRRLDRLSRQAIFQMKEELMSPSLKRFWQGETLSSRGCLIVARSAPMWEGPLCPDSGSRCRGTKAPPTLEDASYHLSISQSDRPLGQPSYIGVMRNENECRPGTAIQFQHDLDDRAARFRIEIPRGLVGEENLR